MKYLGLIIDSRLTFEAHFIHLAPRMNRMAAQLGGLLPNLAGPNDRIRRLFAMVMNSVAIYGAPVWATEAGRSQKIKRVLRGM